MRLAAQADTSPEQTRAIERMRNRRGAVRGPFTVWVRRPQLSDVMEELGTYCAARSVLPQRVRELTLLVTARRCNARHSWNAHVDMGVAAGTDP
jgi:4-carboxymuconolactone decarboxylase